MMGQYDPLLVMLSLMVAVTASWSALDLSQRIHSTDPRAARIWLFSGALVLGTGIWSMHFVGMLAYALPMQTGFDLLITVQSWGVSVLVSVLSLICARRMRRSLALLAAGALAV
ncbi:MAG: bifunctional diguanylate cyclase/phosphodiesterase, partial [Methyloversatilis sp.]|nr:bifunctional diguanylate cyclase/phosphodiesterase [Methyloversatilis sp.]